MSRGLFDGIAPVYGLFYDWQKNYYSRVFENKLPFVLQEGSAVLDVGCGTGALLSLLHDHGFEVSGVDQSERMLAIARRKNPAIHFEQADLLLGLPYDDGAFDYTIASYVAHGLDSEKRIRMYHEMKRVTKRAVLIFDYNDKRTLLTSLVEWLEGGDYFGFIRQANTEMRTQFSGVEVIDLGGKAALYLCRP